MPRALSRLLAVTAAMLVMPAAHAFTIDDGTGRGGKPKFDIEEQARNFRTPGVDLSTPGRNSTETPFGKFHFSTGSTRGAFDVDSRLRNRRDYERMFAPDSMRDRY